jgi:hypothetical protein
MAGTLRMSLGGALWIGVAIANFALQVVVVSQWDVPYVLAQHTVSDLGYTACGTEERPGGELATCSPWHGVFNVGGVLQYAALGLGAWLLRPWWRSRTVTGALLVMAASGVAVSVIPGDVHIGAHTGFAVPLFLGGLVAQAGIALRLRTTRPAVAGLAGVTATASALGLVWLGFALSGHGPVGYAERLGAESIYLLVLAIGVAAARSGSTADALRTTRAVSR